LRAFSQPSDEGVAFREAPDTELGGRLPDDAITLQTGEVDERLVHIEKRAVVATCDREGLRAEMEKRLELALRRTQRVLGRAPVVHVEGSGHPAGDLTVVPANRHHAREMPTKLALRVSNSVLDLHR